MPPNIQKYPSIMSLKEMLYHLPVGAVHVSIDGPVWHRLNFFFPSLSSSKNYSLFFLGVNISTSALILFISQFWFWFFYKSLICFQFYSSIPIYQILYYPLWSSFYGFLIFIISHFIKNLVIFYFILQFKLLVLYFLICSLLF